MFRYCDGPAMLFVECRSRQRKLKTKNCLHSWRCCCIVERCRFGPDCKLARHPEITNTKSIIFGRGRRCYLPVLLFASSNAIYLFSARQSSATNSSKTENPNGFLHILFFFWHRKIKRERNEIPFSPILSRNMISAQLFLFSLFQFWCISTRALMMLMMMIQWSHSVFSYDSFNLSIVCKWVTKIVINFRCVDFTGSSTYASASSRIVGYFFRPFNFVCCSFFSMFLLGHHFFGISISFFFFGLQTAPISVISIRSRCSRSNETSIRRVCCNVLLQRTRTRHPMHASKSRHSPHKTY